MHGPEHPPGSGGGLVPGVEPIVLELLERVPEFLADFLALGASVDDDPGAALTLAELAAFSVEVATRIDRARPVLSRISDVLEGLAAGAEAEELVGGAYLDALSPDELELLLPWFGPSTRALLDDLDLRIP